VKGRRLAGHDVCRHRSDKLAEGGAARVIGEQRLALQPRGEFGLQVKPDPESRVAEDVMYDSKLVAAAAFLATSSGCGSSRAMIPNVVSVIDPCSRSSAHSSAALR
jgi:hypothetical protein